LLSYNCMHGRHMNKWVPHVTKVYDSTPWWFLASMAFNNI